MQNSDLDDLIYQRSTRSSRGYLVSNYAGAGNVAPLAGEFINECRRVCKVGVGDGGVAVAIMPLGGLARVKLRSKLAGRRRFDVGVTVGTSNREVGFEGIALLATLAAVTALVRSSKA